LRIAFTGARGQIRWLEACFRAVKNSRAAVGVVANQELRPYEADRVRAQEKILHYWSLIELLADNPERCEAAACSLRDWFKDYTPEQERVRNLNPVEKSKHHQAEQRKRTKPKRTMMSTREMVAQAEEDGGTEVAVDAEGKIVVPRALNRVHRFRLKARRSDVGS
jgi:hypothetical protein